MRFLFKSITGLMVILLLAGAAALVVKRVIDPPESGRGGFGGGGPAAFPVAVATLQQENFTPEYVSFGEVVAARDVALRAGANGQIVNLSADFTDGGRVEKGDLLFEIDPELAENALAVAEVSLQDAHAELAEAEAALPLIERDIAAAQEVKALRARALERQRKIANRGSGTDAAVDTAALALASAEQALIGRLQAHEQAKTRVARAQSALKRQELARARAQSDLEDTRTVAPFAGLLVETDATAGRLVGANDQLARLIDPTSLEVVFHLTQTQFQAVSGASNLHGLTAKILPGAGRPALDAKAVRESGVVGNGDTGRGLIAAVAGDQHDMQPGDFVEVRVEGQALAGAMLLPVSAIGPNNELLLIEENNVLSSVTLDILHRQDRIVVAQSAHLGRQYVRQWAPQLGQGVQIRILSEDGEAPAQIAEEMVELSADERAEFIARVRQNGRMPAQAKKRILGQLEGDAPVSKALVERLRARGGPRGRGQGNGQRGGG